MSLFSFKDQFDISQGWCRSCINVFRQNCYCYVITYLSLIHIWKYSSRCPRITGQRFSRVFTSCSPTLSRNSIGLRLYDLKLMVSRLSICWNCEIMGGRLLIISNSSRIFVISLFCIFSIFSLLCWPCLRTSLTAVSMSWHFSPKSVRTCCRPSAVVVRIASIWVWPVSYTHLVKLYRTVVFQVLLS